MDKAKLQADIAELNRRRDQEIEVRSRADKNARLLDKEIRRVQQLLLALYQQPADQTAEAVPPPAPAPAPKKPK